MRPTLLINVTNKMKVAQEEIFRPVAVVIKFHDVDEVIAIANDSIYGLGGAVFSKDINKALKVARRVEIGRMWVNTYNTIPEGSLLVDISKVVLVEKHIRLFWHIILR